MELVGRTLFLCLVFALSRAAPQLDISTTVAGNRGNVKPPKCNDVVLSAIASDNSGRVYVFTGKPQGNTTHCHYHRDKIQAKTVGLTGAFVPQCDENGLYKQPQRHGSTGYSWCVDDKGQEIPGTSTAPGTPSVDCSKLDERHCDRQLKMTKTLIGAYVPQCDDNGKFQPKQCHGSTGHCWCVDHLGKEKPGTRTPAGTPFVECSKRDGRHCHHQREGLKTTRIGGVPSLGAYVPQCDEDGQYAPRQCHGSTGHCWCVDRKGQEKPGTRTQPGTPSVDCDKIVDQCKRHRESVKSTTPGGLPIIGAFVPECDENGQYQKQQSHGSTGYSWCVDNKGQEIPGTKTPPGTPSVDCSKAGPIYLRLDTSTGLRSLPITRAWIELGDQVDAAYFYSDKVHLIRGDQVWAYQPDAPFALIEGYPKTVKEELGFEGYVDAAFMCPNEQTLYVIRGTRMLAVDLTAATRAVTEQLPFPVDDIDASLCDRDGVKIFKRSHYYQYENARVLAMSKIAPVPLKITSAILGCKD